MEKQNRYPGDHFPPTNILAAAIKNLPKAGPGILPQKVDIDAGANGRYSVTFVVRQNAELGRPAWFWGVQSSERIPSGAAGQETEPR